MYLGGNYGLNNWLEAGLFIDGGRFSISYFAADETDEYGNSLQYRVKNNYIFRYGLNANIHVLHIFVNPDYYKFDIYVNPKIGLKSTIWGEAPDKPEFLQNSTTFHYGIGAGVGVNFSRRFGLYLDLNNEKFKYNVLRIGANVRFWQMNNQKNSSMKRKLLSRFILLLLSISLVSCITVIDTEFPEFENVPVINAIIASGDTICLNVSLTRKIDSVPCKIVTDAIVKLYVDDVFVTEMI